MKIWLPLALVLIAGKTGMMAPLQLHNRLVFTREDAFKQNEMVWTMNSDGSDQKRVWRVPEGYGQFGCFSGDGKKALSFDHFNLYLHDLQTRRARRVLVWGGGWSSDGRKIVFVRRVDIGQSDVGDYATNLWIADLVGHTEKQLTFLPETYEKRASQALDTNVSTPLFSPEGKRIAFQESRSHEDGIYRIDADGKNQKRLADGALIQWVP